MPIFPFATKIGTPVKPVSLGLAGSVVPPGPDPDNPLGLPGWLLAAKRVAVAEQKQRGESLTQQRQKQVGTLEWALAEWDKKHPHPQEGERDRFKYHFQAGMLKVEQAAQAARDARDIEAGRQHSTGPPQMLTQLLGPTESETEIFPGVPRDPDNANAVRGARLLDEQTTATLGKVAEPITRAVQAAILGQDVEALKSAGPVGQGVYGATEAVSSMVNPASMVQMGHAAATDPKGTYEGLKTGFTNLWGKDATPAERGAALVQWLTVVAPVWAKLAPRFRAVLVKDVAAKTGVNPRVIEERLTTKAAEAVTPEGEANASVQTQPIQEATKTNVRPGETGQVGTGRSRGQGAGNGQAAGRVQGAPKQGQATAGKAKGPEGGKAQGPKAEVAPKPAAKEPWEMRAEEFKKANPVITEPTRTMTLQEWRDSIGYEGAGMDHGAYRMPNGMTKAHQRRIQAKLREGIAADTANRELYNELLAKGEVPSITPTRTLEGVAAESEANQAYYRARHKRAISKALAEGKPVPPEVLADYPDLAAKAKPASAASAAPEVKPEAVPDELQPGTPMAEQLARVQAEHPDVEVWMQLDDGSYWTGTKRVPSVGLERHLAEAVRQGKKVAITSTIEPKPVTTPKPEPIEQGQGYIENARKSLKGTGYDEREVVQLAQDAYRKAKASGKGDKAAHTAAKNAASKYLGERNKGSADWDIASYVQEHEVMGTTPRVLEPTPTPKTAQEPVETPKVEPQAARTRAGQPKPPKPLGEMDGAELEAYREAVRVYETGPGKPQNMLGDRYAEWKRLDNEGDYEAIQKLLTPDEYRRLYQEGVDPQELNQQIGRIHDILASKDPKELGIIVRRMVTDPQKYAEEITAATRKIQAEGWNPNEVLKAAEAAYEAVGNTDAAEVFAKIRAGAKAEAPPELPARKPAPKPATAPKAPETEATTAEGGNGGAPPTTPPKKPATVQQPEPEGVGASRASINASRAQEGKAPTEATHAEPGYLKRVEEQGRREYATPEGKARAQAEVDRVMRGETPTMDDATRGLLKAHHEWAKAEYKAAREAATKDPKNARLWDERARAEKQFDDATIAASMSQSESGRTLGLGKMGELVDWTSPEDVIAEATANKARRTGETLNPKERAVSEHYAKLLQQKDGIITRLGEHLRSAWDDTVRVWDQKQAARGAAGRTRKFPKGREERIAWMRERVSEGTMYAGSMKSKQAGAVRVGKTIEPDVARVIWEHAKEDYIDEGVLSYSQIVDGVARDFGIAVEDVQRAFAGNKRIVQLTDELLKVQADRRRVLAEAKSRVGAMGADKIGPTAIAAIKLSQGMKATADVSSVLTQNAKTLLSNPGLWYKSAKEAFKMFASTGAHERVMQNIESRANKALYIRGKLWNDLVSGPEEAAAYMRPLETVLQTGEKVAGKVGGKAAEAVASVPRRIVEGADRSFDSTKLLRADMFDQLMKGVPEQYRAEVAEGVADIVKAWSGRSGFKGKWGTLNEAGNIPYFAFRWNVSKYAFLFAEPLKMAGRAATAPWNPKNAILAKIAGKQYARYVAGYTAMLTANELYNYWQWNRQDPKTRGEYHIGVNLTDPRRADFMRPKIFGRVLDLQGNIWDPFRFFARLADSRKGGDEEQSASDKYLGKVTGEKKVNDLFKDDWKAVFGNYIRSKLTPSFGMAVDIWEREDYVGTPLPNATEKQKERAAARGLKPWSWGAYLGSQVTPMSIQSGVDEFYQQTFINSLRDEMKASGVPAAIGIGILQVAIESLGARMYRERPKSSGKSEAEKIRDRIRQKAGV